MLDELDERALGSSQSHLVIVDGGKGLEAGAASLRDDVPVQRCTVHKAQQICSSYVPKRLHDEIEGRLQRHDERQGRR